MDEEQFPLEKIVQYKDTYGNIYVSIDPEANPVHKKFIDDSLAAKSIDELVIMYPYIPLKLINRLLIQTVVANYDARVTNYFHILKVSKSEASVNLHLEDIYSKEEKKDNAIVSLNAKDVIINDRDGIGMTPNDERSDKPIEIPQVENWHPNRDANGNYMSAQQMSNYANYLSYVASSPYYGQSYISNPNAIPF